METALHPDMGTGLSILSAFLHTVDVLLHPVSALTLHLVSYVTVYVQGECCRSVAEIALDRLNVVPCPDGSNGERMSQIVQTVF